MFRSFPLRTVVTALVLVGIAGCASKKAAVYENENFDDSGTFSRNYPVTDKASCEAARRALLSQGYIITSNDPKMISGHKSFQQTGESHLEISFNIVCADDGGAAHHSTMFANALQDRYALKKVNNSASLGVGVLGSVSMPIGSSDDSMVKVASETVSSAQFYDRFFALVEVFLPKNVKKEAHIPDKPKADLGVQEIAPAKIEALPAAQSIAPAESAPVVDPAPAPAQPEPEPVISEPLGSQPVVPPVEAAPITPVVPPVEAPVVTPELPQSLPEPEPAATPAPSVVEPSSAQ